MRKSVMKPIELVPSVFVGRGRPGDFQWEIEVHYRHRALYVFNDNVEDHRSWLPGGGNAVIRPYNRYNTLGLEIVAAGVSTGRSSSQGGFGMLTDEVRRFIDDDLSEIGDMLTTGQYKQVVYSAHPDDPNIIGTGIFEVCLAVKRYIVAELRTTLGCLSFELGPFEKLQLGPFEKLRRAFLQKHWRDIQHAFAVAGLNVYLSSTPAVALHIQESFMERWRTSCVYSASARLVPALRHQRREL